LSEPRPTISRRIFCLCRRYIGTSARICASIVNAITTKSNINTTVSVQHCARFSSTSKLFDYSVPVPCLPRTVSSYVNRPTTVVAVGAISNPADGCSQQVAVKTRTCVRPEFLTRRRRDDVVLALRRRPFDRVHEVVFSARASLVIRDV